MKILLANFSKMVGDTGGAAKVQCAFANEMVRRGYEVAMVFCDDRQGQTFYPLSEKVEVFNLQHLFGQHIKYPRIMKIKREITRAVSVCRARAVNDQFISRYLMENAQKILEQFQPNIIITWQPAATKLYCCDLQTNIPVISMSHGDPEDYFHTYPKVEIEALDKSCICQVLLPSFAQSIERRYPYLRVEVIGNVVPQYKDVADLAREKKTYKIIFIGRLVKNHKRPHLLLQAFARIAKDFPEWEVELWGAVDSKTYMKEMKSYISRHELTNQVKFCGTTNNVANVLKSGDVFAFPSAYEGFGLSLGEAMSMGVPAVGYRNCAAVNELIKDGETGFLSEDGVSAFAEALKQLMIDKSLRIKMGTAARLSMRQYSPEKIWGKWEKIIKETALEEKI